MKISKLLKRLFCNHDYLIAESKDVLSNQKRIIITTKVCTKCGNVITESNV